MPGHQSLSSSSPWDNRLARALDALNDDDVTWEDRFALLRAVDDAIRTPIGEVFRSDDRPRFLPLVDGRLDPRVASLLAFIRGLPPTAEANQRLVRVSAARLLRLLCRITEGAPTVFSCYPALRQPVLVASSTTSGTYTLGQLRTTWGTSMFEAHIEYPVDGMGTPKDRIYVDVDGTRVVSLLEFLVSSSIVVTCHRCGVDVTTETAGSCLVRAVPDANQR
jgi:hypothetical protein